MIQSKALEPYRLLLSGAAAIAFLTTSLIVGVSKKTGRNVLKPRLFSCQIHSTPERQDWVWTVMYSGSDSPQPLFRIISGMEGDQTPESRCQQVAFTLDTHYDNGLETLLVRPNPATPNRHAVCIQTQKHRANTCTNLLILKSDTEPTDFFADFIAEIQDIAPSSPPSSLMQINISDIF